MEMGGREAGRLEVLRPVTDAVASQRRCKASKRHPGESSKCRIRARAWLRYRDHGPTRAAEYWRKEGFRVSQEPRRGQLIEGWLWQMANALSPLPQTVHGFGAAVQAAAPNPPDGRPTALCVTCSNRDRGGCNPQSPCYFVRLVMHREPAHESRAALPEWPRSPRHRGSARHR